MRTASLRLSAAAVAACLGLAPGWAQTPPRDAPPHPDGPHQTLPVLPGDRPALSGADSAAPVVPAAPPAAAVLPPPLVVPTRPVELPAPPTVSADAAGAAVPMPGGLRVTFGRDSADLNPATEGAVQKLVKDAPTVPAPATFSVVAHAAGTPDDPSTARRLSLSRALAVRSVLIRSGIASQRIYVRALGASEPAPSGVSPDRVDISVAVPPPPGASAPTEKAAP